MRWTWPLISAKQRSRTIHTASRTLASAPCRWARMLILIPPIPWAAFTSDPLPRTETIHFSFYTLTFPSQTHIPPLLLPETLSCSSAMASPIPLGENVSEAWLPGRDGTQFYTRTYAAPTSRAIVIFVHGFSGHCVRYEWMHGVYASRGITVFAFDQRGFGQTALEAEGKTGQHLYGKTSWSQQLADIEWCIKHVQDLHPNVPVFLMGHSMVRLEAYTTCTPPCTDTIALIGRRAGAGICDPRVGAALERNGCGTCWSGRVEPVYSARDTNCQTCALLRMAVELDPAQLRHPYSN